MRWAIFSDIHSNLPALEAVLARIEELTPDRLLCLGDLVGYGPHPQEVIDRVRALECPVVAGNHDLAAIGRLDASCFNEFARAAVDWTAKHLRGEDVTYLEGLPLTVDVGPIAAVHGTRDEPEEFLYLQTLEHAAALLQEQPRTYGVFGHTHVPLTFLLKEQSVTLTFQRRVELGDSIRALVNVGSVGQPRDEDPQASFALIDDEARVIDIERVPYDIESVIRDIRDAGLPRILGDRLRLGI